MLVRTLLRFSVRAQLSRTTGVQCQHELKPRAVVFAGRSYATPGRPKSVVGEPSRPVKRAVKKAARASSTGDSATETTVSPKRRKATTKKPAKKSTKKPTKKPTKKLAKVSTPEQKEAKKEKNKIAAEKAKVTELKKTALDAPKISRPNSFQLLLAETVKKVDFASASADGASQTQIIRDSARRASEQYKNMTAADLEHYNHMANQQFQERQAAYKRWVESHTPEEIYRANLARRQLRSKIAKEKPVRRNQWPAIKDERSIKRAVTPYTHFAQSRHASGDFRNILLPERSKLIAREWKALDQEEKQKYANIYNQDKERYASEFKSLYGFEPSSARLRRKTLAATT